MSKHRSAVPGGAGFFSLFDLPPTIYKPGLMKALGRAMANAGIESESVIDSGYVYLAQFISHDISKRAPPPAHREFSPPEDVTQQRTPELDLDNVYGEGFYDRQIAVDEDSGRMRLGNFVGADDRPGRHEDLPRGPGIKARIADDRDDENLLIAQLHVVFLKLHNLLVEKLRRKHSHLTPVQLFDEARRNVVLIYQDVILHDFLRTIVDPPVWDRVVRQRKRRLWKPVRAEMARMPVEFAAAAFRFAHAMVRPTYAINDRRTLNLRELFAMTGGDASELKHRAGLPDSLIVDWTLFFSGLCPESELPFPPNKARPIGPAVAVPTPAGSLAELDLATGNRSMLASAQDIVAFIRRVHPKLGLKGLTRQELNPFVTHGNEQSDRLLAIVESDGKTADPAGLGRKSPLWYYILCEAHAMHRGKRLGPLGSLIVAETLFALIDLSTFSVLRDKAPGADFGIEPTGEEIRGRPHYRMVDLIRAVDPKIGKLATVAGTPKPISSGGLDGNTPDLQIVA
jgi:hypothetical protein